MDAFTVAAELMPGLTLTAGQLAQLRAINHRHYTRLVGLARMPGSGHVDTSTPPREPTPQEASELRAMLVQDIRELLTAEQRGKIDES